MSCTSSTAILFNPEGIHSNLCRRILAPPRPQLAVWATLARWIARRSQRRALCELAEANDHLLDDIGLTRAEALREAERPFWR